MIAKITSGTSFCGTERYVEDKDHRNNKIVEELGRSGIDYRVNKDGTVDANPDRIAWCFRLQAMTNERVTVPVGHVSLSFHPDDSPRLTNVLMKEIAIQYIDAMGWANTQWHMVRHCEKSHPHCHIVFNRVDNDGHKLNDSFEKQRSVRVCRSITMQYGLTWGAHKSMSQCKVNDSAEKERYSMSHDIHEAIQACYQIEDLIHEVMKYGIIAIPRTNPNTGEITGLSFSRNGFCFKGSDIDRSLSCGNIKKQINRINIVSEMTAYQRENTCSHNAISRTLLSPVRIAAGCILSPSGSKSAGHDQKDETDLEREERINQHHM